MWAIVLVSPSAPLPATVSGWVDDLIYILVGFWWLMLFMGKVADEEFTGSESAVPAAILAVSWLLILELPWLPLAWMLKKPIFLYGRYIGAPYSHVISTALSVLGFVVRVALLKRSRLAFWLAVSLQIFYFTSSVVTDFTPSAIAEINRAIASLTTGWQITGFSGTGRTLSFFEPMVIGVCLMLSWQRFKTAPETVQNTLP